MRVFGAAEDLLSAADILKHTIANSKQGATGSNNFKRFDPTDTPQFPPWLADTYRAGATAPAVDAGRANLASSTGTFNFTSSI